MSFTNFIFLFLIYIWAVSIISVSIKINMGYNWIRNWINLPANASIKLFFVAHFKSASGKKLKKMVTNPITVGFMFLIVVLIAPIILLFDILPELKKFSGYKSKLDKQIEAEKLEAEKNKVEHENFMNTEGFELPDEFITEPNDDELYYVKRGHHSPGTRAALILKRFKDANISIDMAQREIDWLKEDFITDLDGIKYWKEVIRCIGNINAGRNGNFEKIGDDIDPKEKFGFFDFELDYFKKGSLPYPHMCYAGVPECVIEVSEIVSISGMAENDGIPSEIIVNKHSVELGSSYYRFEYKLHGMSQHKKEYKTP